MKKYFCLFIILCIASITYSQTQCRTCNGHGKLYCNACGGNGYVWYYGVAYPCTNCNGHPIIICNNCGGYGYVQPSGPSFVSNQLIPVEVTVNKCKGHGGSLCSCKKYKGYKHAGREYYEGACSNYINGHKCGHSPEAHGLNK